ncbi:MAG TPA: hypothetical protein VFD70_28775 [Anaerolineae bacterium]|nr:hypothetical protein [Anaerolineae bacterium]
MRNLSFLVLIGTLIGCIAPPPPPTQTLAPTTALTESPAPTPLPTSAQTPFASHTSESRPAPKSGTAVTDPTLVQLIAQAKADLAQRVSAPSDSITVKSTQAMEWSDASLGCPKPGVMYIQVITPGYLIVLQAGGKDYNYHTSLTQVVLCES